MGMFDVSEETFAEYSEKFRRMAAEKVDEPVLAVGLFRRGGAASSFGISRGGLGGIAYAANALRRKKVAGGLPNQMFLIVTPTRLHVFRYKHRGREYVLTDEAAVWERSGLRISTEIKLGLTMLTIDSPGEGERATVAPGGVKDDPWSQEVTRVLSDGITEVPA